MTYLFEVYYRPPADAVYEATVARRVAEFGGRLEFREDPAGPVGGVCLTFEFDDLGRAETAADALRRTELHVEGPCEYAD